MHHTSPHPHRAPPRLAWLLALISLIVGLVPGAAEPAAPPIQLGTQPSALSTDLSGWQVLYRREGWRGGAAVDLRAAGDVMLGRYVGAAFAGRPAELFSDVAELLDGDVSLANLESPLTERAVERPGPYRLVASPDFAPALRDAGLDILGLANNHALDAGPPGLAEAVAVLREAGLQPVGVAASEAGAFSPVVLERNGLRVAVLAFNDVIDPADGWYRTQTEDQGRRTRAGSGFVPGPSSLVQPTTWLNSDLLVRHNDSAECAAWALGRTRGSARTALIPQIQCGEPLPPLQHGVYGRAWLSPAALDAVTRARSASDLVVVLVHWGVEYQAEPSLRQRAWAERLVAAGADLVLGAHPHVPQPAQLVAAGGRSGFVAYSLGNLVFDGPDDPQRNSGLVLRALLDREGVALVAAAPVTIDGGRPSPVLRQKAKGKRQNDRLGSDVPTSAAVPPCPRSFRGGQSLQAESPFVASRCGASPLSRMRERGTGGEGHGGHPMAAIAAWRWDGAAGAPIAAPPGLALGPHAVAIGADLRGSGEPNWATLDANGVLVVREGPAPDAPIRWRNEAPGWRITRVAAGDPNDDGRVELLLLLWQPDSAGTLRSHPFLLGWRGGRYQIIWGGSATAVPIQDLAVADLEGDGRSELVVLEGGALPGDPGEHVSVWRWHGWGFQLEWRSNQGGWRTVGVVDFDGDGRLEIVVE